MSQKCPHKQENRPSKEQLVDLMTMKGPRERGGHATKPGAQPPPGRGPCDQPLGMEQGKKKKIPDGTGNRGPVNREQRSRDRSLLSASRRRGPPLRTESSGKEKNKRKKKKKMLRGHPTSTDQGGEKAVETTVSSRPQDGEAHR